LYSKGLVYRGVKVMPYSTACNTPLSNFESGQNYKEVQDPAGNYFLILKNHNSIFLYSCCELSSG
jgi:isoleucyl-tRNA synthetase